MRLARRSTHDSLDSMQPPVTTNIGIRSVCQSDFQGRIRRGRAVAARAQRVVFVNGESGGAGEMVSDTRRRTSVERAKARARPAGLDKPR